MDKGKSKKTPAWVPSVWKFKNLNFFHPNTDHALTTPIVDTHTHLLSMFSAFKRTYPNAMYDDVWDFVRDLYFDRGEVKAIVDVWCEAPVQMAWKELADSALRLEDRMGRWGGIEYWFVMGVHPHNATRYDDAVEESILEAMKHPRCVGWGEIGLDYHYDNSPRDVQQQVFTRQLRAAVRLGKPLTIHTREAEEDTERILREEVPVNHKIHLHCFTDAPAFARRLLAHFPNLYVGITGVITYSTNQNTAALVRQMARPTESASTSGSTTPTAETSAQDAVDSRRGAGTGHAGPGLRFLLETDAPFMVPANVYASHHFEGRFRLSHSGMIPWTATFVADTLGNEWDARKVMEKANENAMAVYGKLHLDDFEFALAGARVPKKSIKEPVSR